MLERIRALALNITDLVRSPKSTAPGEARKKAYEIEVIARAVMQSLYPEQFAPPATSSEPTEQPRR